MYLARFKDKQSGLIGLLGTALTEIAMISQIYVVLIYWPVLHKPTVEFISKLPDYDIQYQLMVWIHLLPFLGILGNVILSKIHFREDHWPAMAVFAVFYMLINFILVKFHVGKWIYPFLPWDNVASYIIAVVLIVAGIWAYRKMCQIVNKLKGV